MIRKIWEAINTDAGRAVKDGLLAILFMVLAAISMRKGNSAGFAMSIVFAVTWAWCSGVGLAKHVFTRRYEARIEELEGYCSEHLRYIDQLERQRDA